MNPIADFLNTVLPIITVLVYGDFVRSIMRVEKKTGTELP